MQSDSQGWGGAWDPAFLTGAELVAMLLVWGAVRPPLHGAINTGQDDVHGCKSRLWRLLQNTIVLTQSRKTKEKPWKSRGDRMK